MDKIAMDKKNDNTFVKSLLIRFISNSFLIQVHLFHEVHNTEASTNTTNIGETTYHPQSLHLSPPWPGLATGASGSSPFQSSQHVFSKPHTLTVDTEKNIKKKLLHN